MRVTSGGIRGPADNTEDKFAAPRSELAATPPTSLSPSVLVLKFA